MKLYVKNWCPWCVDAERWLKHKGFSYHKLDVLADRQAYTHMRAISGQELTPTLEMPDGDVLADFDVDQLEAFLAGKGLYG